MVSPNNQPNKRAHSQPSWPVAVSPQQQVDTLIVHEASVESVTDAWRFLLENAKNLAEASGIRPEDLILGASSIIACYFHIFNDFDSDSSWHQPRLLHSAIWTSTRAHA
jgi:hypothetical protein